MVTAISSAKEQKQKGSKKDHDPCVGMLAVPTASIRISL
jgi:hypothetical protein